MDRIVKLELEECLESLVKSENSTSSESKNSPGGPQPSLNLDVTLLQKFSKLAKTHPMVIQEGFNYTWDILSTCTHKLPWQSRSKYLETKILQAYARITLAWKFLEYLMKKSRWVTQQVFDPDRLNVICYIIRHFALLRVCIPNKVELGKAKALARLMYQSLKTWESLRSDTKSLKLAMLHLKQAKLKVLEDNNKRTQPIEIYYGYRYAVTLLVPAILRVFQLAKWTKIKTPTFNLQYLYRFPRADLTEKKFDPSQPIMYQEKSDIIPESQVMEEEEKKEQISINSNSLQPQHSSIHVVDSTIPKIVDNEDIIVSSEISSTRKIPENLNSSSNKSVLSSESQEHIIEEETSLKNNIEDYDLDEIDFEPLVWETIQNSSEISPNQLLESLENMENQSSININNNNNDDESAKSEEIEEEEESENSNSQIPNDNISTSNQIQNPSRMNIEQLLTLKSEIQGLIQKLTATHSGLLKIETTTFQHDQRKEYRSRIAEVHQAIHKLNLVLAKVTSLSEHLNNAQSVSTGELQIDIQLFSS